MSILRRIIDGTSKQRPELNQLRESRETVVVYGAGVYAYVLIRYLVANGISVSSVMVDAACKDSAVFMGHKVITTEDNIDQIPSYQMVVGIANYPVAVEKLKKLGAIDIHVIDVPDFLNIPNPFMDMKFVRHNIELFDKAYQLFADDLSRETYIAAINTKLNEDLSYIRPYIQLDHLYFSQTEFPLTEDEILLDVGGFNGDSIRDFHRITKGHYRGIVSLEPFTESFEKLQATIESLGLTKIVALKIGAWNERTRLSFATKGMDIDNRIVLDGNEYIEVDTIDNIIDRVKSPVTLIKMDINGAEFQALVGAREVIRRYRPKISVKMHVKEDFFRLPILLKELNPDIKLYLRQRNLMSMMLVLYGVF